MTTTSDTTVASSQRRNGTAIVSAVFAIVAFPIGLFWNIPLGVVLAGIGLLFGGLAVYRNRESVSIWAPALVFNLFTFWVGLIVFFFG